MAAAVALGTGGLVLLAASPVGASPTATTVDHWGSFFGDENHANDDEIKVPTPMTLPGKVAEVATSNSSEYTLLTNGTVYAWGQGDHGELGNGATTNSFTTAVQVEFPAGVTIASLPTDAMPYDTALAVDTNGNVWGWGWNASGELCLGASGEQVVPVELPRLSDVTAIAGAGDHALFDANGTVYACGGNNSGDLGDGSTTGSFTPVKVVGLPATGIETLVAAYEDSGALTSTGAYYDWGLNSEGQLGDGSLTASSTPVLVNLDHAVGQVVQGGSIGTNGQTLVRLTNGNLWAWGDDQRSQLGDGGTGYQKSPVRILLPSGVHFVTLATGAVTSYGITPGGNVYAWGGNGSGQVGSGTGSGIAATPVLVDSGATLISATANNVAVGR